MHVLFLVFGLEEFGVVGLEGGLLFLDGLVREGAVLLEDGVLVLVLLLDGLYLLVHLQGGLLHSAGYGLFQLFQLFFQLLHPCVLPVLFALEV